MSSLDFKYLRRLCAIDLAQIKQSITALDINEKIQPTDKEIIREYYEHKRKKAEAQYDLLGQITHY